MGEGQGGPVPASHGEEEVRGADLSPRHGEVEEPLPPVHPALRPVPHPLAPPHRPNRVRPPRRDPAGPAAVEEVVARGAEACRSVLEAVRC